MANIAITSHCNLNCSYCFTQEEYQTGTDSTGHMSLSIYQEALDFVIRSDIKQIRILGGEPTLHPDFMAYIEMALKTGRPVRLFSNGFIPEKVLDFLDTVPDEQLNIVLNITHLVEASFYLATEPEMTLQRLHRKIIPGLNLYKKEMPVDFLLDLIRRFDLKKSVRLGLAHPCVGFKNEYLLPKHYLQMGQKIIRFAKAARQESVKINLDCGFVPCMFGHEDWRQPGLASDVGRRCEPIPDILPDGSIVSCYPLSGLEKQHITSASTAGAVREHFKQQLSAYDFMGIFKICSICEYRKRGLCTGGCTAHKILRLNSIDKIILVRNQNNHGS